MSLILRQQRAVDYSPLDFYRFTYVVKEGADVGGDEQHISERFHVNQPLVQTVREETPRRRRMTRVQARGSNSAGA